MGAIAFRVDASFVIGTGHVMRCLTLAGALRERGLAVSFICREHDGHLCGLIEKEGFVVARLRVSSVINQAENANVYAAWLGATWQVDADQTRAVIEAMGAKPDWLVVDHYALDQRWENNLRSSVGRIMAIDDLAERSHDCDLLLDQNLVADMQARYLGKVPANCGLLLGPEYALLQPVYAQLHNRIPMREGQILHILIYFGGADNYNLTGLSLSAFLRLNRPDIEVDVVITVGGSHAESISQMVEGHGNIHLHSGLPTLAPLVAKADLAIGAGGATSWERLCLGLPALVVTLAENQRPIADELSQRNLIRWLGHWDVVYEQSIAQALIKLIQDGLDENWSLRCHATVDGNGVNRVSAALTVMATTPLQVRHANLEDEARLLEWANDATTRRNAFSPEIISAATHRNWFRTRLRNINGCDLYIVETIDGVPLGQVRFERQGPAWEVHYALAPIFRGRGLGRPLLATALRKLRADKASEQVFGQVKSDNQLSRKIFESLGFERQPDAIGGVVVYLQRRDGGS